MTPVAPDERIVEGVRFVKREWSWEAKIGDVRDVWIHEDAFTEENVKRALKDCQSIRGFGFGEKTYTVGLYQYGITSEGNVVTKAQMLFDGEEVGATEFLNTILAHVTNNHLRFGCYDDQECWFEVTD